MAFFAIPAQEIIKEYSFLLQHSQNEVELKLEKISDLSNLFITMQKQLSGGVNQDLENIRIKINEFIAKLQDIDKGSFKAVLGNISPIKKNIKSLIFKQLLAIKLKEFFDDIFQRVCKEIMLEDKDLEEESIKEELLATGFEKFKQDALRPSNKVQGYNTIKGIDGKVLKEADAKTLFYVLEKEEEKNEDQKKEIFDELNKDLNKYLQKNHIKNNDIEKFKSLIYLLFSQYSMQQFVVIPIYKHLLTLNFMPQRLIFEKEDFSINITILDKQTLRIDIQSNKDSVSKIEKGTSNFRAENENDVHGLEFCDIKSSFTFRLDRSGEKWTVINHKITFTISNIF